MRIEYGRKWYAENKQWFKEYYSKNKEKIKTRTLEWRIKNKDKAKEIARRCWQKNKSKTKIRISMWRAKNRSHIAKYEANYRKANRSVIIAKNNHRRAVKNKQTSAEEKASAKEKIANIMMLEKSVCGYCGMEHETKRMHVDHIVPISRGGRHAADNIQIACQRCNTSKGDRMLVDEWMPPIAGGGI